MRILFLESFFCICRKTFRGILGFEPAPSGLVGKRVKPLDHQREFHSLSIARWRFFLSQRRGGGRSALHAATRMCFAIERKAVAGFGRTICALSAAVSRAVVEGAHGQRPAACPSAAVPLLGHRGRRAAAALRGFVAVALHKLLRASCTSDAEACIGVRQARVLLIRPAEV